MSQQAWHTKEPFSSNDFYGFSMTEGIGTLLEKSSENFNVPTILNNESCPQSMYMQMKKCIYIERQVNK